MLTIGFCGILVVTLFLIPRNKDIQKIASLYQTKKVASVSSLKASDQKRKSVRKDAFFTQSDGVRLHYRIDSESSTLYLLPTGHKVDIVEDLKGIRCFMQEKLFMTPDTQQSKFFKAEQGLWSYAKQEFQATSVNLCLLKLPGHEIPGAIDENSAFLKGLASGVKFSFSGKKPNFHAEKFQASVKGKGEKR